MVILALGAASGKSNFFSKLLKRACFGNLTANFFLLLVTCLEILEFFFNFKMYVMGPGENFL